MMIVSDFLIFTKTLWVFEKLPNILKTLVLDAIGRVLNPYLAP